MVARKTAGDGMGAATIVRSAAARAAARVSTDDTLTAQDQGLGKSPALDTAALRRAKEHVAKYGKQDNVKGAWVVGVTLALWVATLLIGVWWFRRAPLTTLWGLAGTACWAFFRIGSYVRAFVVMHDAIHNALFTKRWMNTAAAIVTGLVNGADAPGAGIDRQRWQRQQWHGSRGAVTATTPPVLQGGRCLPSLHAAVKPLHAV